MDGDGRIRLDEIRSLQVQWESRDLIRSRFQGEQDERALSMSDIVDLLESSSSTSVSNECLNVLHDDDLEENNETPFQSLVRLHSSYSNYNERKNAVKYIVDALRSVEDVQQLEEILSCTKKLADDIVTQVQIDCLEKFVPIIEYLVENVENAHLLIKEYLYQSIIQTIGHPNNRIRKGSQSALIRLFEFDQIPLDEIEETLIPSLCQLDRSCDDFKNESILLMTRLTQYVPHDLVLKYFLPTIVQQSTSIAFQTRKTCATAMGDLSTVLPPSAVDQHLVPCLSQLCSDPFWGVRKSCAEVIHPVAQVCSEESRWNILSPCLIQLLQDQSRWVKTAALRVLGYFISTFLRPPPPADPSPRSPPASAPAPPPPPRPPPAATTTPPSEFGDFLFWKESTYLHVSIDEETAALAAAGEAKEASPLAKALTFPSDDVQRILPIELLDSYRNLIEQSYSSGVEVDIVHQGAHTFPAVALTLSAEHWHLLRDIHRKFAEDLQWKVRRTLAYSLHELAKILHVQQVEEDLCPTFDSFLRDVDEVKIGILSHLTDFLRVLNIDTRRTYLDRLNDLVSSDNQRNWRFRSEAANQLNELTKIYSSSDIAEHLCPLMFSMSMDRVAFVRLQAIEALSSCFGRYVEENSSDSLETFVDEAIRLFGQSTDWKRRQLFVQLVEKIFLADRNESNAAEKKLLAEAIRLKGDAVVNVRLSLAAFLAQHLNRSNPLKVFDEQMLSDLQSTVEELSKDADRDVRSAVEERARASTGADEP